MLLNFTVYDQLTYAMSRALDNNGSGSDNRIEVYKGTMPADADDWVVGGPGSPSELLVTFSNFRLDKDYRTTDVQAITFDTVYNGPNPNPVNATATGTATWYAMYDAGGSNGVIIGDVSATGGTGTLQLDSVSLTSGNPVTVTHWGFRLET